MQKINLSTNHLNYDIEIGSGFFDKIPLWLAEDFDYPKVFILTDENVGKIYLETFLKGFESTAIKVHYFVVPAGESSKSLSKCEEIYEVMIQKGITRKDLVITLGGGVVGDLGGFVASTYLRGVDFIQIPTTLLSQVDSSVGGKVGVNLASGKNLVGSFYHPKAVYIDIDVLNTLEDKEFKSGMAEVIKYGLIKDKNLFSLLESNDLSSIKSVIGEVIKRCIEIKAEVVAADEKESYIRMILNFGHTFGHAVEKAGDFSKYTHGEAVGIGMALIVKGLLAKKLVDTSVYTRTLKVLNAYGLNIIHPYDHDALIEYVQSDKKKIEDFIQVVLLKSIGECYIEKVDNKWLREILEAE